MMPAKTPIKSTNNICEGNTCPGAPKKSRQHSSRVDVILDSDLDLHAPTIRPRNLEHEFAADDAAGYQ